MLQPVNRNRKEKPVQEQQKHLPSHTTCWLLWGEFQQVLHQLKNCKEKEVLMNRLYTIIIHCTHSLFSHWLILEPKANFRNQCNLQKNSYLLADNWLLCRLRTRCMIVKTHYQFRFLVTVCLSLFSPKHCIIKQLLDSVFVIS